MRDLEALRRHFVDFGSSLGVIFSILGALGRVSGAIFSQSRILKRFFAKFYRFGKVLARFGEEISRVLAGSGLLWATLGYWDVLG